MKQFLMLFKTAFMIFVVLVVAGCSQVVEVKLQEKGSRITLVNESKTIVAKPGETVELLGENFSSRLTYKARFTSSDGSVREAPLTILSKTAAKFELPDGLGLGEVSYEIYQGADENTKKIRTMKILADEASNTLPIITASQSEICSTLTYINRSGEEVTGTKNCTTGGVVDCTADGQTNCRTSGVFKSADSTVAIAGNIRSGVTIAGQAGSFTSATPNAWDLRAGVTVGGVTGRLKVNCRNRIRSSLYNYDGPPASIPDTGTTAGTFRDWWDTIDDRNADVAGLPNQTVAAWSSDTDCGGIEASAGDTNVWKDVTTTGDGVTASTCAATSAHCTMQDKITGLHWSKLQGTSRTWPQAINDCDILSQIPYYNGATDWRLPTQKELMEAYNHGIRSAESANWMTAAQMNAWFWSASSVSNDPDSAWFVLLAIGKPHHNSKTDTTQVLCVR
jgi:hypothetical protein